MSDQVQAPHGRPEVLRHLGLIDVSRLLWRRRQVITAAVVLITGLVAIAAYVMPPQYTAIATLLIENQDPQILQIQAVLGNQQKNERTVETMVELITSRSFLRGVVTSQELEKDPEFNQSLPGGPRVTDWVGDFIAGVIPSLAGSSLSANAQREQAVNQLLAQVQIEQAGETDTISIRVTAHDPEKAARIANAIGRRFITARLQQKQETIERVSEWLNARLEQLRDKVTKSELALAEFRNKAGISAAPASDPTLRQMDQLNVQLVLAETRRAQAEARLYQARGMQRTGDIQSAARLFTSPVLTDLRTQLVTLQREAAEASTVYGPSHPKTANLNAEIDSLLAREGQELSRIVAEIESEAQVARAEEASLRQRLGELQGSASAQSTAGVPALELERQSEADRAIYTAFLTRYREVTEQFDIASAGASLASEARAPASQSWPNKSLLIGGSFASSIVIGFILAFLVEMFDTGLRSARQVEEVLGVPTLALVPRISSGRGRHVHQYLADNPRSTYADAMRTLKLEVTQSNLDRPPRVIALTSALPGEGKSTLALSLAAATAIDGHRAVVVDLDLHRPRLRSYLSVPSATPGIVELLAGEVKLEEALVADSRVPGLSSLTVRRTAANPSALFATQRMSELLETLEKRFDLVVLDTPPSLAVGDVRALARYADTVVYVVRWGSTPADAAQAGLERLRDLSMNVAGAVVNQVDIRRHAQGAYGDGLQYYKRYSRYYSE